MAAFVDGLAAAVAGLARLVAALGVAAGSIAGCGADWESCSQLHLANM